MSALGSLPAGLWWIPIGMAGFGLLWFLLGYGRRHQTRDWVRTTGMVVTRNGRRSGMPARYPTFEWADPSGRTHRRTSMVGASLQPGPGTPVPVKYDPRDPSRAVMDTFSQSGRAFYLVAGIAWAVAPLSAGLLFLIATVTV